MWYASDHDLFHNSSWNNEETDLIWLWDWLKVNFPKIFWASENRRLWIPEHLIQYFCSTLWIKVEGLHFNHIPPVLIKIYCKNHKMSNFLNNYRPNCAHLGLFTWLCLLDIFAFLYAHRYVCYFHLQNLYSTAILQFYAEKKGCSFNFALRNNLQKGLKGKFMKEFSI